MSPRVLPVDDVPAQRDVYPTILEHAGYAVLEAVRQPLGPAPGS